MGSEGNLGDLRVDFSDELRSGARIGVGRRRARAKAEKRRQTKAYEARAPRHTRAKAAQRRKSRAHGVSRGLYNALT